MTFPARVAPSGADECPPHTTNAGASTALSALMMTKRRPALLDTSGRLSEDHGDPISSIEGGEGSIQSSAIECSTQHVQPSKPRPQRKAFVAAAIGVMCATSIACVVFWSGVSKYIFGGGRSPSSIQTSNPNPPAAREYQTTYRQSKGLPSGVFSMTRSRIYKGPRLYADAGFPLDVAPFPRPDQSMLCLRWAVFMASSSGSPPTEAILQLIEMKEWCVLVVGDVYGPTMYDTLEVIYLSPADQERLPYRIVQHLPQNHIGRKSVGYLYAIHHGAQVIYDVDEGSSAIHPGNGIPFSDSPYAEFGSTSPKGRTPFTGVLNPYPCFGGPTFAWPRGFPLDAIGDPESSRCDTEGFTAGDETLTGQGSGTVRGVHGEVGVTGLGLGEKKETRLVGVVQSLAKHNPDVDALYRLAASSAHGPPGNDVHQQEGERRFFDFAETVVSDSSLSPGVDESGHREGTTLRIVPKSTFTPYNAQATLHFPPAFWGMLLPVTVSERVSDIWRSYFTQALLPTTGAVVALSSPWVTQVKTPHDCMADFHAELALYEQSGALVEFLSDHGRQQASADASGTANNDKSTPIGGLTSIPYRIETLAIAMYEHEILDERDVTLTREWLKDLISTGYTFDRSRAAEWRIVQDEEDTGTTATASSQAAMTREETKTAFYPGDELRVGTEDQPTTSVVVAEMTTKVAKQGAAGGQLDKKNRDAEANPLTLQHSGAESKKEKEKKEKECESIRESVGIVPDEPSGRVDTHFTKRWELLGCNSALGRTNAIFKAKKSDTHKEALIAEDSRQQEHEERQHIDQYELGVGEEEASIASPVSGVLDDRVPSGATAPSWQNEPAVTKPHVLLVIAVVSIRPERRAAIRKSWLTWANERVVLRFFTEAPDDTETGARAVAQALTKESRANRDMVVLEIDRGMNFALKLIIAMRYLSDRYTFEYFLRLDDDYFVCLPRLLDELDFIRQSVPPPHERASELPLSVPVSLADGSMLYQGHRYCEKDLTRIDEAFMLLSGSLVERVLSTPDIRCSSHAGVSAGWWFTPGHKGNRNLDVVWVHDPRLDHYGDLWKADGGRARQRLKLESVCKSHVGVHHTYPMEMALLWDAVKGTAESQRQQMSPSRATGTLPHANNDECGFTRAGVSPHFFDEDNVQPCQSFKVTGGVHCGAQGC